MKWVKIATILIDGALIGALIADIVFTINRDDEVDAAATAEQIANGLPSVS